MTNWSLTDEENDALDALIFSEPHQTEPLPNGWKKITIAVPEDFYSLMLDTIEKYKIARETTKTFPALEAIFIEARNSLPV